MIIAFVVALSALVVNGNYGPIAIEIKLERYDPAFCPGRVILVQ